MRIMRAVLLALVLAFPLHAAAAVPDGFDPLVGEAIAAMLSKPQVAIAKARTAAAIAAHRRGRDQGMALATTEWLQAEAYVRLNKPDLAAPLIASGLRRVEKAGPDTKLHGDLLMTRGEFDSATGRAAQALGDYQQAHDIYARAQEDRGRARALINIAVLYDEAFDHDNALKYYGQARSAYAGDPNLSYSIASNIGQTLKEAGRYPQAEAQTRHALILAQAIGSKVLIIHALFTLGRIELQLGQLDEADRHIAAAVRLSGRDTSDEAQALLATAAQAALQRHRIPEAVALVRRSFEGVDLATTPMVFRERHHTAYDVFKAAGDDQAALSHLAAMKRLDDEATRLATSTNAAIMGARFDFANQQLRIANLQRAQSERSLAYERQRARSQQLIFSGAVSATLVVITLLGIGLFTIRRSRNETRRANRELGASNDALGRALEAKTEFLATTSHEIRTPLNGILGMTQVMLADQRLDAATRDRIEVVHGAGVTMRTLVDDILDVAKMETGNLAVEMAPVKLAATLGDLTHLWAEQARAKGLTFAVDLDDCPALVDGDAARLRQIVFNLLSNAIKFTPAGSVRLRAWTVAGDAPRYRVAITDTGIGIAPDKFELIFEMFRQADTSTTRQFGGTGLGLAICRRLSRAMGGDVTVASVEGEGSTFVLDLPLVTSIAETAPEAMPSAMLVIERNPIARSMLKALLAPAAGEIVFAGSVSDALAVLESGAVERILADDATLRTDRSLMEALASLARVKGKDVELALLWSAAADDSADALAQAGVSRLLRKPIGKAALVAALFNNLDHPADHLVPRAA